MSSALSVDDFQTFFREVHGYPPFPWQTRLARQLAERGQWPDVLDLPTGSGKTAALDVAVFHLALEAARGSKRCAPVRIALVVDRRLVVDDAFERARKIETALADPAPGTVTASVAESLRALAGEDAPPLLARRLRGGIPREDDWARTPSQPTILCSTVDQVGSRLLFRGYGVSDRMKPIHAGLVGTDCLILLDEAHLSEPFRQTLGWVHRYKGKAWREDRGFVAPWGVTLLTATPGTEGGDRFTLDDKDYANPVFARRWAASKPACLVDLDKSKPADRENEGKFQDNTDDQRHIKIVVARALEGLEALQKSGLAAPALGVVVNRVARARSVFEELRGRLADDAVDLILMIGPARPADREELAVALRPIRTGARRSLEKPLIIVSTQCIEAGVDIDLDGLITEAAPIDALRQRFGRVNRDGRSVTPYAAIVGGKKDNKNDPVYGESIGAAWKYLVDSSGTPGRKGAEALVDFGLADFAGLLERSPLPGDKTALAPKSDAPVLLPAHLDLLSQTAPIPAADPEVALYLHGPGCDADSVTVVWRADIDPGRQQDGDVRRLLLLVPPRTAEAIGLPIWAVRRWLNRQTAGLSTLADIPASDLEDKPQQKDQPRRIFRWAGDDGRSAWIDPKEIRPGDTIVVPAAYGGVDKFGWNPDNPEPAADVADRAAAPFAGRRFALRIAPGLLGDSDPDTLAQAIAGADGGGWRNLRDAVRSGNLPQDLAEALKALDRAKGKVETHTDLYSLDNEGRPRGIVFVAPFGLKLCEEQEEDASAATEDDVSGSLPGFALPLQQHSAEVEQMAERFARLAGLPEERVLDLQLAAYLHDAGKADTRFQAWLAYDDPLGHDPERSEQILAKSARPVPRDARSRSGLPGNWRHEALSVRLAPQNPHFATATDPELVLWLIGSHHGHGRPFFPHADPLDKETRTDLPNVLEMPATLPPGPGPQALSYDWKGMDWPSLYECLKARYGVWELARMEAILRLADHRASEQAERRAGVRNGDQP